jgi:hypothetical protein
MLSPARRWTRTGLRMNSHCLLLGWPRQLEPAKECARGVVPHQPGLRQVSGDLFPHASSRARRAQNQLAHTELPQHASVRTPPGTRNLRQGFLGAHSFALRNGDGRTGQHPACSCEPAANIHGGPRVSTKWTPAASCE